MRIFRRPKRAEAVVDLYDEESLNATEYALVSMRLVGLEDRVEELEYLLEHGVRREYAGQMRLPGVA